MVICHSLGVLAPSRGPVSVQVAADGALHRQAVDLFNEQAAAAGLPDTLCLAVSAVLRHLDIICCWMSIELQIRTTYVAFILTADAEAKSYPGDGQGLAQGLLSSAGV